MQTAEDQTSEDRSRRTVAIAVSQDQYEPGKRSDEQCCARQTSQDDVALLSHIGSVRAPLRSAVRKVLVDDVVLVPRRTEPIPNADPMWARPPRCPLMVMCMVMCGFANPRPARR